MLVLGNGCKYISLAHDLYVPESSPKHPTSPVLGKAVFQETSPWCQKGWGLLAYGKIRIDAPLGVGWNTSTLSRPALPSPCGSKKEDSALN